MSTEQMTIRERLEWLAGDRDRRIVIAGMAYRVSPDSGEPEIRSIAGEWHTLTWPSLFFDERVSITKVETTPAPTELEKAEAELAQSVTRLVATLRDSKKAEAIQDYMESRLKVERLRAEVRK